jgi:hypothetical protein
MQPCPELLSQLPQDLGEWPVEDALKYLLSRRLIDSQTYFECKRHKLSLVEYINAERH